MESRGRFCRERARRGGREVLCHSPAGQPGPSQDEEKVRSANSVPDQSSVGETWAKAKAADPEDLERLSAERQVWAVGGQD